MRFSLPPGASGAPFRAPRADPAIRLEMCILPAIDTDPRHHPVIPKKAPRIPLPRQGASAPTSSAARKRLREFGFHVMRSLRACCEPPENQRDRHPEGAPR